MRTYDDDVPPHEPLSYFEPERYLPVVVQFHGMKRHYISQKPLCHETGKKKETHSGSFERRTWRETLRAELRKPVLWHFNQLGPVQSQRPSLQTAWG